MANHLESANSADKLSIPSPPSPLQMEANNPSGRRRPTWQIVIVTAIAAGIQFGWALQLSLLTPYVQLLGIPHRWASLIWLCGPVSGMIVQPIVGYYSDCCTSRFGRRRPFIAGGAGMVAIAVFMIGYAADIGVASGDDVVKTPKVRAISVFIIGFWILDVANNLLQGPCRALLADLAGGDSKRIQLGNSLYAFFMGVGNVLGYAAGSENHIYKVFPFTKTRACNDYCANLKTCFFISISLLLTTTVLALTTVKEDVLDAENERSGQGSFFGFLTAMVRSLKELSRPMWILLIVTGVNWVAWFPFVLYDTDWMGREVYGGKLGSKVYNRGVRAGAMGLLLNSVVSGLMSVGIQRLSRVSGGVKRLWGGVNVLLAVCMAMTIVITKLAESSRHGVTDVPEDYSPPAGIKGGAFAVFAALGVPLAVTYSIPFALASIFSNNSGHGQGLSLGTVNIAICIPQMVVSFGSGPLDAAFKGGNIPAFTVGTLAAAASAVLAFVYLPSPPKDVQLTAAAAMH